MLGLTFVETQTWLFLQESSGMTQVIIFNTFLMLIFYYFYIVSKLIVIIF